MNHHLNTPAPVRISTDESSASRRRREEHLRAARQATTRRLLAAALIAMLLWLALALAMARPAAAHDELIGSTPENGAVLDTPPAEITLSFSANVMDIGATTQVLDTEGTDWAAGAPVLSGSKVSIPLQDGMPDGDYQLGWRVVSSDGHPIEGNLKFSVAAAGPATSPAAEDTGSAAAPAEQAKGPSTTGLFVALGAGALAIAAGLAAFVISKRGGGTGGRG
ncbi:copper resistance protein CopC [Arthrobacter sulfonylureivorans]|uniref:copper resistance CopC family protein n=1 Tax=Arthrobacter sulfonylureivorans TaxID=2486855 RepID=UPI0039E40EFE